MRDQLPATLLMNPQVDEAKMSGIDRAPFLRCFEPSDRSHHSRIAVGIKPRIERFVLDLMVLARPARLST